MSEILTKDHDRIKGLFQSMDKIAHSIDEIETGCKPNLNGERFLTDNEVSLKLKVSRRTLQEYRNEGIIGFIQLGGKMLYKESDIVGMLESNYRKAYKGA